MKLATLTHGTQTSWSLVVGSAFEKACELAKELEKHGEYEAGFGSAKRFLARSSDVDSLNSADLEPDTG